MELKRTDLASRHRLMTTLLLLILAGCSEDRPIDFNTDIRPILNSECMACHGGVTQMGGFSMLFPEEAYDETDSGKPALIPGDPDASELMRRVQHHDPEERMPLESPPLLPDQIEKLRRWIEQGARWEDHWAYVGPVAVATPMIRNTDGVRNDIDLFIRARLEEEGLRPSDEAECGTLIRRVSQDLTGLPPDPDDVLQFCEDPGDEAYEIYVDQLLDSPGFGERWAAMWLDLARYADSQGYEKDNHRTIWRYRDWVIEAFNNDIPFDRFTIEQLAGDLLEDPTEDQHIATAFHRNTMTNDEGGTDDEEFRIAAVIDRVNTTWEVWQGTTMACVQCHSHPYDPFRHEEFYKSFAFFNSSEDADRSDEAPVLVGYSRTQVEERQELLEFIESARQGHEVPVQSITFSFDDDSITPEGRLARAEEQLEAIEPVPTPVMRELPAEERRTTRIFEGGNWLAQGDEVQAGVPGSLPPLPEDAPPSRLGLAEWLVSTENPLTARVIVNRFWDQLFGQGIVGTIEDFGTQGFRPTHPELLDYLALRFMHEHEWSVKALLRQIVTSATYRQSSYVTPDLLAKDPRNHLLARGPRFRLSAEQVRDNALAVSGLLSDKMFGPSVMPPQPDGVWANPYSNLEWVTSEGEDRYRRGLYTYWRRTAPYPSMLAFDATSREVCVSRRVPTNTPIQALVLLNDPVYVEAARMLAHRMRRRGGKGIKNQLTEGYFLALSRHPGAAEIAELKSLYQDALENYESNPEEAAAFLEVDADADTELAALATVAGVILNLDSFVMKE